MRPCWKPAQLRQDPADAQEDRPVQVLGEDVRRLRRQARLLREEPLRRLEADPRPQERPEQVRQRLGEGGAGVLHPRGGLRHSRSPTCPSGRSSGLPAAVPAPSPAARPAAPAPGRRSPPMMSVCVARDRFSATTSAGRLRDLGDHRLDRADHQRRRTGRAARTRPPGRASGRRIASRLRGRGGLLGPRLAEEDDAERLGEARRRQAADQRQRRDDRQARDGRGRAA